MNKKWAFIKSSLAIVIVVVFVVIFFNLFFVNILNARSTPLRQAVSEQSFKLAWKSDVISPLLIVDSGKYNDSQAFVLVQTNRVILPTNRWGNSYLTSFYLETGKVDWEIQLPQQQFSIGSNLKEIIVVLNDVPPRQDLCDPGLDYCEAAQFLAYDAESGEEIWTFLRENMWRAGALTVDDNVINIIGSATRSSHREKFSLNADTGTVIDFQGVEPILA